MINKKPKIFITNDIIENQVTNDLIAFQKIIKKSVTWPIDPEFFVKSLWGLDVIYEESLKHPDTDEDIVACLLPSKKKIIINLSENQSDARMNYSTLHEAGHASLHSVLGLNSTQEIEDSIYCRRGKNEYDWRIEQQANHYASCLLLPKHILLSEIPDVEIDLNIQAKELMNRFGVSRMALELRLHKLGFKTINNKYDLK